MAKFEDILAALVLFWIGGLLLLAPWAVPAVGFVEWACVVFGGVFVIAGIAALASVDSVEVAVEHGSDE